MTQTKTAHLGRIPAGVLLVLLAVFAACLAAAPLDEVGAKSVSRLPSIRAVSEIKNVETALAGMLSDTGESNLSAFFEREAFESARDDLMREEDLNVFDASVRIYTTGLHALIRQGRAVLSDPSLNHLHSLYNVEALPRLGTSYIDIGDDPWGSPYQFFIGPWPEEWGPSVFRIRRVNSNLGPEVNPPRETPEADALTVTIAGEDEESYSVGYPATPDSVIYMWSLGWNGVSDQARFDVTGQYAPPARGHYRPDARDLELGGGDDINSWDRGSTWKDLYEREALIHRWKARAKLFGVGGLVLIALFLLMVKRKRRKTA